MTMRWRTSSANEPSAGAAVPLEKHEAEDSASHEAASTSASASASASTTSSAMSSPLVGAADDMDAPDSSLSAAVMQQSSSSATSQLLQSSSSPGQAIDLRTQMDSDSAADPDGDPPYTHRQQQQQSGVNSGMFQSDQADDGGGGDDDDDDSMKALPALEGIDEDDAGDDQEVPWKPQATQSTCEFTHTIANYSQKRDSGCKKAEYSATTVDEFGNRWRLIVYVNGNGRASNHHLSLFLQVADADDLPFGWKKAVSYVLTLEHPTGPNLSYAKRNPDKTFKLCPKAIDWGWSQFITSDRIQQEGFVQDDSLVVRASVTVKSSSVSIDLEDAELYLKCAVEEGKPEAVQLCLDQGASVNCQFKDDLYTPLHTACSSSTGDDDDEEDDEDDSDVDDDDSTNKAKTASHTSGSMRVLQLLLEKGADGNACNKWRETPLLIAANNGHRSAVEALLRHGADPSLCSEAGWSALTFAAHKGYEDIVQLLLKAGAPVNCRVTEDASTPLHKACAGSKIGHLSAVRLLLANRADVHALNKWRETPLLTAANHGQAGAVDALLKAGADPCKCTDTGWSPLSIAAYKGHDDVVKLLLEEGAPTEEADPTLSALLQAATKGLPDTVELLLKHGADHTVTTKKGDTALSILVEQNLIDAAVDMVTEYNASVPRCSRDRKKVQRARLLINLRVKQRQREGKNIKLIDESDDEEDDHEESPEGTSDAFTSSIGDTQYDNDENGDAGANGQTAKSSGKKNKKKKKKKSSSAEQQAKAAEEALLMELEQEDADRQKQEDEANKKSAKKRKKKERERQQKKDQEEKRMAEEEAREAKLRKEREDRESKERAEQDRVMAVKRKAEEEQRKHLLEKQQREQQQREDQRKEELQKKQELTQSEQAQAKGNSTAMDKKGPVAKTGKRQQQGSAPVGSVARANTANSRGNTATAAKSFAPAAVRPVGKNRGWEIKPGSHLAPEHKQTPPKPIGGGLVSHSSVGAEMPSSTHNYMTPQRETSQPIDLFSSASASSPFAPVIGDFFKPPAPGPPTYTKSEPILSGLSSSLGMSEAGAESPAVALFRRDKVSELLQRCTLARSASDPIGIVDEATIKKVVYRWIVRASHESSASLDCVIPSWMDYEKLTAFFQRQFISESRKGMHAASGSGMVSMESLKDAGSAMASLSHSIAKEVADFRREIDLQLPSEWNDGTIGMKASDMMRNGSNGRGTIVLDWANRAQVYMPAFLFNKLRERYTGPPSRLLSSLFTTKVLYDTKGLVTADTTMEFSLPPETLAELSMKANVTAEVWTGPMSVLSGNVFWGQFAETDKLFGGLAPFSKTGDGENLLVRHGGSVVVTLPQDNMVASRYMGRMVDVLESAESGRVPVSFAVFLRADCFLDGSHALVLNDLFLLEPRLRDRSGFIVQAKELAAGHHSLYSERVNGLEKSATGSLLAILQNPSGQSRFVIDNSAMNKIMRSLGVNVSTGLGLSNHEPSLPIISDMSFSAPEFVPRNKDMLVGGGGNDFFNQTQPQAPVSPMPHQSFMPDFGVPASSDYGGAFGSSGLSNAFSSTGASTSRSSRPARGRLFDLVDDGGDDDHGTADVVSGMLGNLNMDDLFSQQPSSTNANGDIDIEAISLMGIGGPPPGTGGLQPRRGHF